MIQFIFLDLDDTILDFRRTEAAAIRATLSTLLAREPEECVIARYRQINLEQWRKLERGEVTREQLKTVRFERLFAEMGVGASPSMAQHLYEKNLSTGHLFIDGAPSLLQKLYGKYSLHIVSNGNLSVQRSRIASSGIARYFDGIFISEEVGANKPKKAFFDACFAQIPHFSPDRAVILGDSLTSDIQGGINAGIRTCLFVPHEREEREDIVPDFEIRRLSEFFDVLKELNGEMR